MYERGSPLNMTSALDQSKRSCTDSIQVDVRLPLQSFSPGACTRTTRLFSMTATSVFTRHLSSRKLSRTTARLALGESGSDAGTSSCTVPYRFYNSFQTYPMPYKWEEMDERSSQADIPNLSAKQLRFHLEESEYPNRRKDSGYWPVCQGESRYKILLPRAF